ncbi:MAG TPA: response regulator [Acetobacteraceae bacterium]|nr:response regulator [Acetobacteraceae bacterium]
MDNQVRTYRLLIVDDDEVDRRHYAKLLAQQPHFTFTILEARDGAEGLKALKAGELDCLLLDYSLPDMTGLEFLAEAVADGDPPCAMVLITGHGSEMIAVEAMKRGVRDYLTKEHVNEATLWRAVEGAIAQRDLQARLAHTMSDLKASNAALEQQIAVRKLAEAELRAARDTAEEASHAKTRFLATMSHELRTPLQCILGYADLLRLDRTLTAQQSQRIGAMMEAGRHLLGMIERVLDFASIEAGKLSLRPEFLTVADVAEGCIAVVEQMAQEQGLALGLNVAADAPLHLVADAARTRQILLNLLGNALKYTVEGSVELRVLRGEEPGGVRFEVVDTGPGIDQTASAKLFRNFERLEADNNIEGTGLGLAISARLAGLMQGNIGHAANPGGGSIFWLELPPGQGTAPVSVAPVPQAAPTPGKRLLVVDDIGMNRDVIGAFLHAAGHEVMLAESGEEAIRYAFEQRFDLILMDVRMPDMDGLEATRRIRALPPPRGQVPILGVTAHAFLDQVADCRAAGMDGHVAKPVAYATLMGAIDNAIARVPARWHDNRAAAPVAPPAAAVSSGVDRAVLDETLAFLRPEEAASHLKNLRLRQEDMVRLLDMPTDPSVLTESAHALASVAGMFGFTALSDVARRYEHAMADDAAEAVVLGRQLRTEARAALATIDTVRREIEMQPA